MTTSHDNITIRRIRRLAALAAGATILTASGGATAAPLPLPNFTPVANLTVSPSVAVVGQNVAFNAAASYDIDGTIARYEWDLDNNGVYEVRSSTVKTAYRSFPTHGVRTVRLRVTDNRGATGTTTRTVTVHRPPVALLTADRAVPNVDDVVGYRATGSYDPDGDAITRYLWDLNGDGVFERSSASPYIQTSFPTPGMHRLAVKVVDARNAVSAPRTLNVRVNDRPTAVVSATPNPAVMNQQVQLSGAASTDDRGIVKYEWDLDGNGTYETDTGANPRTTTMFTALGQARIGLQVTDTDGAVDRSTATISVNPAPVADTKKPILRITPASVKMRGKYATLRITCPVTEMSCSTRLTLKGRTGVLRGKVIGRASKTVPGGRTIAVHVPLTAPAIRTVRRNERIAATATAVARDLAGNVGTASRVVTIRR